MNIIFNKMMHGFAHYHIRPLVASGIAGFAAVVMALSGSSLDDFSGFGHFKSFAD